MLLRAYAIEDIKASYVLNVNKDSPAMLDSSVLSALQFGKIL